MPLCDFGAIVFDPSPPNFLLQERNSYEANNKVMALSSLSHCHFHCVELKK